MKDLPNAEIQALLAELWQKNIPLFRQRLNALEHAASIVSTGPLPEEARVTAQAEAHKLAGSLGMFGHHQAGDIALEIETILKTPEPERFPDIPELVGRLGSILAPHLKPNKRATGSE